MPSLNHLITPLIAASLLTACGSADDSAATPTDQATAPATPTAAANPPAPVTLASLTGDAARGERVFGQCRACHAIVPGQNLIGPSLHGVVGRKAGMVTGYAYSPANKGSAMVWDRETLFTYLEAPLTALPGTKMAFALRDPQQRADVIAYMETLK
jgi:cytochrome c